MKNNVQGVVMVVAHVIITIGVLVLYFMHPDDTLRNVLTLIVGYWFGSMGASTITSLFGSKNAENAVLNAFEKWIAQNPNIPPMTPPAAGQTVLPAQPEAPTQTPGPGQ